MVVDYRIFEDDIDALFQALADRTRRDILRRTIGAEESVSSLARRYAMSFAAVQKHVAVLARASLVTKQRRGREQLVRAHTATIARAITLLDAYEQLWIASVDRIDDVLARTETDPTPGEDQ